MSDFSKLKTWKNGKEYILNACTQDTEQNIIGTKNFTKLTVNSKNVVTSINGISPSEDGNVKLGNAGASTGEIKWFAFNTTPDGFLVCNGANVSRETYADLFAVIGTTFGSGDGINAISKFGTAVFDGEDGNLIRVTVATNESDASSFDVTTYFKGSLVETQTVKKTSELVNNSYVVWDTSVALVTGDDVTFTGGTDSTTFTLPNLIDKFAQGSTTVGTVKSAGLPNITGTLYVSKCGEVIISKDGTFQNSFSTVIDHSGHMDGSCNAQLHIDFNASLCNSIYGNSPTVQPPALTLLPCIKY